ncbi:MAG: hypothetical protein J6U45_09670, partial [Alistipes sp.]|nr:hypothetical protein [Alistipes sp.]
MFEFLVYLAQSAICLATLYLIYKVAMSYETLHSFNRVLLLGSVVLSALLPLCHVRIVKEYDAAPTVSAIEIDDMVVAEVAELGVDYIEYAYEGLARDYTPEQAEKYIDSVILDIIPLISQYEINYDLLYEKADTVTSFYYLSLAADRMGGT